jgi:hypothetical protein
VHADVGGIQAKLSRRDHVNVLRSLQELGLGSAIDLVATQDGRASDLVPWLRSVVINRDRNLRLLYLAGLSMNLKDEASIYDALVRYRPHIEDDALARAVENRKPRVLTAAQASVLSAVLAGRPPSRITMSAVIADSEALQYAGTLREALLAGGWPVSRIRQSEFSEDVTGLLIFVGSDPPPAVANELFQALRTAGLTVEGNLDPSAAPGSVSLVVGSHR